MVYWDWVAAGTALKAQDELLQLAIVRQEKLTTGVDAGAFAEIDLILNEQLVAERRAKLLQAEQKLFKAAFKLSLFLRDDSNQPLIPNRDWLPSEFPVIQEPNVPDLQSELANAFARRPELTLLALELQQVQLDRRLACNQMLPRLDFIAEASQDMGEPSTSSDDKGDFELILGITSEVPIQLRKARGKVQSTTGKIGQIQEKQQLTRNKIAVELQTAFNALELTYQIVQQSEQSVRTALETLRRYRVAFRRGKIDLIYLNLLETKANETELKLIEAQRDWFDALVDVQFALGIDPLDSAMEVAALPLGELSEYIDMRNLPTGDLDDVIKDWEIHEKQFVEDTE